MIWERSNRFDPAAVELADRHYNRQKVGTPQFVPPGRCLVLRAPEAVWVSSWPAYARHAWNGAWVNTTFRREGGDLLASEMILQAVAATRWRWPSVPDLGMITFIDADAIRRKRDPGRCYRRAGFEEIGRTEVHGRIVLQLVPERMPPAEAPLSQPEPLFR